MKQNIPSRYSNRFLEWAGRTGRLIGIAIAFASLSSQAADWEIVNTTYETDDMVFAGIVMDSGRLPGNPETQNCSTAINNAIQDLADDGGGYVYLPAGTYLCTQRIELEDHDRNGSGCLLRR